MIFMGLSKLAGECLRTPPRAHPPVSYAYDNLWVLQNRVYYSYDNVV